jgi:murein DD-endopeptidase MepM/ murein hydrolase activator NlpD|tara:strand:- start:3040 stop:4011 length:972 start_codon:yes stop_codon:yes gene_type:complete
MPKVKYYYDSDSLSFKEIKNDNKTWLKYFGIYLIGTSLSALFFILVASYFFESPKEKYLKRELENMKINYNQLADKMDDVETVLENVEERDNNIYRIYFESKPITDDERKAGFGGINRYKKLDGYEFSSIIKDVTKRLDIIQKRLIIQSKSLDYIGDLAKDKEKFLSSIPAIQPVNNDDLTRVASGFGNRIDPFTKAIRFHHGIDFTAPRGTPVYATGDGYIERVDSRSSGYGKHIRINHGYGYISLYAHLHKYNVVKNQKVKRGDLIGYVGSTGRSSAPHLHYEIFKDGVRINPINFYYGDLSSSEYQELIKQSSLLNQSLD